MIRAFVIGMTILFATTFALAANSKKLTHREARAACLKEKKGMKGKALQRCIKGKRAAK